MKKLSFIQGAVFAITLSSVVGIAATVTGLNTFTSGTPISSSQMNNNFTILKNAVEATSSQVYLGTHDASTGLDPTGATAAGEYYIITTAGTTGTGTYAVGDWAMFNGTIYTRVPSTSLVTSVFGRTGAVVAVEADYNLTKLADVTITTPAAGNFLTFNGSQWVNQPLAETDPQTQGFAKTAPPTCAGGEFLKSNGTSLSCVPGAVPFSGTASKVVTTDGSGNLISSSVSNTELGYLSGVTSSLSSLPSLVSGHTTTIGQKADTTNVSQTITALAVTGLSNPVASSDATNKLYVDTQVLSSINNNGVWNKSGGDIYYTSGFVGIGTSAPTRNLDVIGTAHVSGVLETVNIVSPLGSAAAPIMTNTGSSTTGIYYPSSTNWAVAIAGVDALRIGSAGNVGLGLIPSSGDKLEVAGPVLAPNYKIASAGTSTSPSITYAPSSTTGIYFPTAGDMAISTNTSERMRFTSTGNIGVGTSSPTYSFSVNGSIGAIGTLQTVSDIRYKKEIRRIPNALEKLLSLDGVSYSFRQDEFPDKKFSKRRELGVIAQKVERVFPEAVSRDNQGFRSVGYSMLIAPIIEAIREIDTKSKTLEAENKMLKDYLCQKDPNAPFCEE